MILRIGFFLRVLASLREMFLGFSAPSASLREVFW